MSSSSVIDAQQLSTKELKVYLLNGLESLRKGEYFTEFGLSEDVKLLGDPKDASNLPARSDKQHPFNRLLSAVATAIVKDLGIEKKKKKFIKHYEEVLHGNPKKWANVIRKTQKNKNKKNQSLEVNDVVQKQIDDNMHGTQEHPNENDELKKRTGKEADILDESQENVTSKKRKIETQDNMTENEPKRRDPKAEKRRQKQKEEFEKEKDEVLADIPNAVKKRFGQACFAKWSKDVLPALCLSPYSVPPGEVRNVWFNMYDKVKANNRLANMTNLVYWYGSSDDPANGYSLIASSQIIKYEDGVKKGYDQVSKGIKRKLELGKKLSATQNLLIRGLEEMNDDLQKPPEERRGPIEAFKEVYDISSDEDGLEVEEPDEPIEQVLPPKKNLQKKNGRKKSDASDHAPDELEGSEEKNKSKEVKVKKKKGRPPKVKVEPNPPSDGAADVELGLSTEPKKKNKKKSEGKGVEKATEAKSKGKKKVDKIKAEPEVEGDPEAMSIKQEEKDNQNGSIKVESRDDIGNEQMEVQNNGDGDNEATVAQTGANEEGMENIKAEPENDEVAGDSPEENDEDHEPETESDDDDDFDPHQQKKVKKTLPKSKVPPKKKASKAKVKIEKKVAPKKKKTASIERLRELEQERFEKCEDSALGILKEWENAIEEKDETKVNKTMEKLLDLVDTFSAPFLETYNFASLIKETKKIVDNEIRKKLRYKMKDCYLRKKSEIPDGFIPQKRSEKKEVEKPIKEESHTEASATPDGDEAGQQQNLETKELPAQASSEKNLPIPKRSSVPEQATVTVKPPAENLPKPSPAKPERKKFSLGGLMRTATKERKINPVKSVTEAQTASSSGQISRQPKIPTWISEAKETDASSDKDRCFALEFLQQAVQFIPMSKHVNHDAIASGLELSIYDWARELQKDSWVDKYWGKVHDIVAAISGKREKGTLATLIGEGKFSTPASIVNLTENELVNSFESQPL